MSIVKVDMKNPLDGTDTYATISLERSPDDSSWTEIASGLAIDAAREYTAYTDSAGSTTAFYRHRFRQTGGTYSDYSPSYQVGDSLPLDWVTNEITDTAVGAELWTQWIEQALIDLYILGIWYEGTQSITPTLNSAGAVVEYYDLNAKLREVFAVELRDATTGAFIVWLEAEEWTQEARKLRLFDADDSFTYVAHGKAQYKRLGELTDDFYTLILWMMRRSYVHLQLDKRKDFRRYIVSDPSRDITIEQLNILLAEAEREVATRTEPLREREPGYAAS